MKDALLVSIDGSPQMADGWGDSLINNLFLSIYISKGSFWFNPDFGSLVHTIKTTSEDSLFRAREFALEATRWIIEYGKASTIDVTTAADSARGGRMALLFDVTRLDGSRVVWQTFVRVI